jgi:hypothetical protein
MGGQPPPQPRCSGLFDVHSLEKTHTQNGRVALEDRVRRGQQRRADGRNVAWAVHIGELRKQAAEARTRGVDLQQTMGPIVCSSPVQQLALLKHLSGQG